MNLRCPQCCSEGAREAGAEGRLECPNCGTGFARGDALVSLAEAEAHAAERAACTCEEWRACPPCFGRAEALLGATVRDSQGREWVVTDVGEKSGHPTIIGGGYWDRPDQVEVLREAT